MTYCSPLLVLLILEKEHMLGTNSSLILVVYLREAQSLTTGKTQVVKSKGFGL